MKSAIRPKKRRYRWGEWQPWFAWRPVRVSLEDNDEKNYSSWRWVWWEWVERTDAQYVDIYYKIYRMPKENP